MMQTNLQLDLAFNYLENTGTNIFLTGKAGTGNAEWQTIIAAQEDRSILLPDGSSVYLRENSELSYPEVFASSVREVKIKGEAFFEVTPNSEQPFIVDASG